MGVLKMQSFCGAKILNIELANHTCNFYIPKTLHNNLIYWYQTYLMYPGATRADETIKWHLYWPCLQKEVNAKITKCETCQFSKKSNCKFGHLS